MDQDNDLIAGKIKQFFDMVEAKTEDPSYVAKEEEEEVPPDSPGSQIGTEEFRRKNKRTIQLSEKSGVPAKVIFSIIKAESSPHYARAVNANQLYKVKTIKYKDKKLEKLNLEKKKHIKKTYKKYNVPEEFFDKVEELRKEKNFKWNQGMKGISYKDHKKRTLCLRCYMN